MNSYRTFGCMTLRYPLGGAIDFEGKKRLLQPDRCSTDPWKREKRQREQKEVEVVIVWGSRGEGWGRGGWTGQHVYLKPWDNEEVESKFLVMELFLLVRHTHSLLRTEMESRRTYTHTIRHTCMHTPLWRTLMLSLGFAHSQLMVRQRHGGTRPQAYLTMDAFSQGRLRVSEREGGNKIKTAIKKIKKMDAVQIIITRV